MRKKGKKREIIAHQEIEKPQKMSAKQEQAAVQQKQAMNRLSTVNKDAKTSLQPSNDPLGSHNNSII